MSVPEVTVVVPWRGGQTDRDVHADYVRRTLREMLPDAQHLTVDTDHRQFSRSAARNEGVRRSGGGVVVLCDADTIPEAEPLHAAINAATDGRMHLPYSLFKGLSREGTLAHYMQHVPLKACATESVSRSSTGGVIVMLTEAWWAAGGMDETFQGWGFEDSAFRVAADCLLGPTVTHSGVIYHLWHPTAMRRGSREYQANQRRFAAYRAARRTREDMAALVGLSAQAVS